MEHNNIFNFPFDYDDKAIADRLNTAIKDYNSFCDSAKPELLFENIFLEKNKREYADATLHAWRYGKRHLTSESLFYLTVTMGLSPLWLLTGLGERYLNLSDINALGNSLKSNIKLTDLTLLQSQLVEKDKELNFLKEQNKLYKTKLGETRMLLNNLSTRLSDLELEDY